MNAKKIAIIVRNDLLNWQKLNVVAFLASSIAIEFQETHGRKFIDASNISYLSFLNRPVMIFKAGNIEKLKNVYKKARARNLNIGIYTEPLFSTNNEEHNIEAIKNITENEQDYVGIILYGERSLVDKSIKGLKLHD